MLQNIFSTYEMHSALVVKSREPYINSAATNYRRFVCVLQHVGFCCVRFVCCCFLIKSQMKDFVLATKEESSSESEFSSRGVKTQLSSLRKRH